ncbi:hypothetical protein EES43_28990 [Streptomyces sp. ADI96-02]|nr:hypothetical protein EES43_28990 [Streptomyces sp. ADI96-02]
MVFPAASFTATSDTATTPPERSSSSVYSNSVRAPAGETTAFGTTTAPAPSTVHSTAVLSPEGAVTDLTRPCASSTTVSGAFA